MNRSCHGVISEGDPTVPFYTDLRNVFEAFAGLETHFNWLITDLDCTSYPPGLSHFDSRQIISGPDLSKMAEHHFQVVWGVFSGIPVIVNIEVNEDELPYADCNGDLWRKPPHLQHHQAVVEIVCWDSSLTLVISTDTIIIERFCAHFPLAMDLDEYNRKHHLD